MIDSDMRHAAVYYLGLADLVEARLASSGDYIYSVKALDAAWQWVEHQDISGDALADLFYDEDGFGVGASMAIERNKDLLPVWGCVSTGLCFAARAASLAEGQTYTRDDIDAVDSPEARAEFSAWFASLIPVKSVLEHYQAGLSVLRLQSVTRSAVRDCAFAALHSAALEAVAPEPDPESGQ